jgi:hypothetical protein
MFHDQPDGVFDYTRDTCLKGARTDAEQTTCEEAYDLAVLGLEQP